MFWARTWSTTAAFSLLEAIAGEMAENDNGSLPDSLSLFALKVNLGLLIFSFLGFLLPSYLFYYRARVQRQHATDWEAPLKAPGSSDL